MEFCNFTKKYLKLFSKYKYLLDDNNILLNYIKNERYNILSFKKRNKITITKLNKYRDIYRYTNNHFVDTENLLNDMQTLNIIYKIKWANNQIIIMTDTEFKTFDYIKLIIHIIEYLKYKSDFNIDVNIYIVLSKLEKFFPKEFNFMDVKNVNSGYNDPNNNVIFIWRKEEFEKVLFHELIHNFNLDKRHDHTNKIINSNGPHLYFEAITDFQGIIYHLIYLSILTKKSIKRLLEYELGFIRNQAMTLNDMWGWNNSPTKIIEQGTAAFSYYILKYLIFEYYLYNNVDLSEDYSIILKKILKKKLNIVPFIKIDSCRMTLLQLK